MDTPNLDMVQKNASELTSRDKLNRMLEQIVQQVNGFAQEQLDHIRSLTKIGISLSVEQDLSKVFDMILEEALLYTKADGATIYSLSSDKRFLEYQIAYNNSLGLRMGGSGGEAITWPPIAMYHDDGTPVLNYMATYVAHTGEPQRVDDVYTQTKFDNSGTRRLDKNNNYRSKSMVAIPLKDHEQEVLGVIQLINAMDADGVVIPFTEEHMAMLTSLASIAAIIMTNKKLIDGLENLLYEFIRSIAHAIDRKSRDTGNHINRVAILTEMIAGAINQSSKGVYRGTSFSHEELKEISLAGWMHDLGKIITPEHVQNKSTKLETVFDRIELIRTRFKLVEMAIRKDVQRCIYKRDHHNRRILESMVQNLKADLKFLERINTGHVWMSDRELSHLKEIFSFRYTTHGETFFLLTNNEYENLRIRIRTLHPSEIQIMRDHAKVTNDMLNRLTFPKKFRNVPVYAAAHHEKLNGKGYPLGLKGDEMPLQARIIALADFFEALTSADRPYKKGNKLSESLRIIAVTVRMGETDPDLFDLFLDTGLFRHFARDYVAPSQIDEVNIEEIKAIYR